MTRDVNTPSLSDTLLLVDAGSVVRPIWEAEQRVGPTVAESVARIVGYCRDYREVVVCWDSETDASWRRDLCPTYKANRPEHKPGFIRARGLARSLLELFGVPVLEAEGFEADDLIATCVAQGWAEGRVHIYSEDKDLAQCLGGNVEQITKQGRVRLDAAAAAEKHGVPPALMRDFLAMAGDTVDGFGGCPGVGKGKAAQILNRFGGIAQALAPEALREIATWKGFGPKVMASLTTWDPTIDVELATTRWDAPVSLGDAQNYYAQHHTPGRRSPCIRLGWLTQIATRGEKAEKIIMAMDEKTKARFDEIERKQKELEAAGVEEDDKVEEAPPRRRRRRTTKPEPEPAPVEEPDEEDDDEEDESPVEEQDENGDGVVVEEPEPAPKRRRRRATPAPAEEKPGEPEADLVALAQQLAEAVARRKAADEDVERCKAALLWACK